MSHTVGDDSFSLDSVPGKAEQPVMLRDTVCQACEQDVYLIFQSHHGHGYLVKAVCHNPACLTNQETTSPAMAPKP